MKLVRREKGGAAGGGGGWGGRWGRTRWSRWWGWTRRRSRWLRRARPLDFPQLILFRVLRAQKIRAHRTGAEEYLCAGAPALRSRNCSVFPLCLRGARLGRNHFNLPAAVVKALHSSFVHALRNQRANIQLRFRLIEFPRAGVQRRSSRHEDRATIVKRLGGSLVRADLARRGQNFHLVGADQRAEHWHPRGCFDRD